MRNRPSCRRGRRFAISVGMALLLGACAESVPQPTIADAETFIRDAESRLLALWIDAGRAAWVQNNFITPDTKAMAASANAKVMAATTELVAAAAEFRGLALPADVERKLTLLKTSLAAVAPSDPTLQQELAELMIEMESLHGQGGFCPEDENQCVDLPTMERMFADVRETDELLAIWSGWREVSPAMLPLYERFVEISNAGAQELGFADTGEMWRSAYDMPPDAFTAELERLWGEVRPLYESLHCYVRAQLGEEYGTALVPEDEPIPVHLLGNMWGQTWANIFESVQPSQRGSGYDLTRQLERDGVDAPGIVRYGERFFSSIGFEPLPTTFWDRSLFLQPADRDVVCHASAWAIDFGSDVRVKMCLRVTAEDFVMVHRQLGHTYYQRAYSGQDPLYRAGAHDGFHEGIGDTVALSMTPEYLVRVGLLDRVPPADDDIRLLLRQALDTIAFLPFGLLVDQWRWQVFSGEISPERYNSAWWELRREYQGVRPPVPRSDRSFDPGAKYHVPANTPYARYFLARILQFQFHRALCAAAGVDGPLHRCSIYGNVEAGARLSAMLEMGASQPWPEALDSIAGTREMDTTALLDYFAPLAAWLDEQNQGRTCGW